MHKSTLVAVALAGAVSAANSTVQLFIPGFDTQSLVGSVIGSDAAATTYAIACGDPNAENCGLTSSLTVTEGPSTLGYSLVAIYADMTQTMELNCNIINSSSGVCTGTVHLHMSESPSTTSSFTTTTSFTDASELGPIPVTITAGAVGSSASTAVSTTGSTSPTKVSSASTQTGSSTGSGSAAAATGSPTSASVSTGGVPMITQGSWVFGGAAAALAYAAM